ncbi:hypothetical protein [Clostridium beijerinckii]|uniref:hypothetical protein n=1 Tax=Clostridium beijerinckii TaxID=1520 RepID=UPI00232FA19A|nr:hypothetical protein [Clostridium beijerinckii]
MEKYLKDEYNVFEDEKYLTKEEDIEDYFKDCGQEWLECGQGYAQDEATILCKIGGKFFKVEIKAELGSAKQEYGDRLYWIDNITCVDYEEISKPVPKERIECDYKLFITKDQKEALENAMNNLNISFKR